MLLQKDRNDWRTVPWTYAIGNQLGLPGWNGGYYVSQNGIVYLQLGEHLSDIRKGYLVIEYTK